MDVRKEILTGMKDYNGKFQMDASKELKLLQEAIKMFSKTNADLTYRKLTIHRKSLVTPYLLTDELFSAQWLAKSSKQAYLEKTLQKLDEYRANGIYPGKNLPDDAFCCFSDQGVI